MTRYDAFGNKYNKDMISNYRLLIVELRAKLEQRKDIVIDVEQLESKIRKQGFLKSI